MQQGVDLGPLVPLFTFAKTRMHADILSTPLEQFSEFYIGYEPPWDQKSHNKLLWRGSSSCASSWADRAGSTTGVEFNKHTPWRLSQRARLHMMSQDMEGEKEVIWSQRGAVRESNMTVSDLNHLYMDTAFSGVPHQCDPETCKIMEDTINFKPLIGLEDSNMVSSSPLQASPDAAQYKYLMDVDGNGWSGRFHRLMSTRSLVLKYVPSFESRLTPQIDHFPRMVPGSDRALGAVRTAMSTRSTDALQLRPDQNRLLRHLRRDGLLCWHARRPRGARLDR